MMRGWRWIVRRMQVLFAVVAALLAALGIYSVLAYQVAGRRHEIGVRMALGASVDGVAGGVVRRGLLLSGLGLLVGVPAAILATRLIRSSLFGIEPVDPLTYAVVSVLVVIVTTVACLLPARRVARVDPVTVFRAE
jgi:ABC-type antimicrobial peptide transport system permease subunit